MKRLFLVFFSVLFFSTSSFSAPSGEDNTGSSNYLSALVSYAELISSATSYLKTNFSPSFLSALSDSANEVAENLPQCYESVYALQNILNDLSAFLQDDSNRLDYSPVLSVLADNLISIYGTVNDIDTYLPTLPYMVGCLDSVLRYYEDEFLPYFEDVRDFPSHTWNVAVSSMPSLDIDFDPLFSFLGEWSPNLSVSLGSVSCTATLDFDYSKWNDVFSVARILNTSSDFTDPAKLSSFFSLPDFLLNSNFSTSGQYYRWATALSSENTPDLVSLQSYSKSSDWFSTVHYQLNTLLDQNQQSHQTTLTILYKLCASDQEADQEKQDTQSRVSSLSSASSEFSNHDISTCLSVSAPDILTQNPVTSLSSNFSASLPSELTLDLDSFVPSNFSGSNFHYAFNINLAPYDGFLSTLRSVCLFCYWFLWLVFAFFVFRFLYKSAASCAFYFLKLSGSL